MAPLTPFWAQPSYPNVQEVRVPSDPSQFTTKSFSKVNLPPFGLFAKLDFPPCTVAGPPTYATVQMGRDSHLNLNSDLVYINHACEPTLIFDTTSLAILAGPRGLRIGDELTFFYPSTEWSMAQGFHCLCRAPTCRGFIAGAKEMTSQQLEGIWLNAHIRELLEERDAALTDGENGGEGVGVSGYNGVKAERALMANCLQASKTLERAQKALDVYRSVHGSGSAGLRNPEALGAGVGPRGVTNREMSGEMGGDTSAEVAGKVGVVGA